MDRYYTTVLEGIGYSARFQRFSNNTFSGVFSAFAQFLISMGGMLSGPAEDPIFIFAMLSSILSSVTTMFLMSLIEFDLHISSISCGVSNSLGVLKVASNCCRRTSHISPPEVIRLLFCLKGPIGTRILFLFLA